MSAPIATELTDRGVIRVAGPDAVHFVHNLVTCDIEGLDENAGAYGALLSPQGKIVSDFLAARSGDAVFLDLPAAAVGEVTKRLSVYRLRAKATIEDVSADHRVVVFWDTGTPPVVPGPLFADPRAPDLGLRAIVPAALSRSTFGLKALVHTDPSAWQRRRIALAIPEAGRDFALGEAFPHDADMDDLNGVDFRKGCYVGQEVVSRMQHRGTARRRIVKVRGEGDLPDPGTPIEANGRPVGTLGSSAGPDGVALVRLDRAREAMDAGAAVTAGPVPVTLEIPAWASFSWPQAADPAGNDGGG